VARTSTPAFLYSASAQQRKPPTAGLGACPAPGTNVDVTKNATVREMSVLDTLVECVGRVGQRADCLWFSPGAAAGCASRG
jgi:hypothetical protein